MANEICGRELDWFPFCGLEKGHEHGCVSWESLEIEELSRKLEAYANVKPRRVFELRKAAVLKRIKKRVRSCEHYYSGKAREADYLATLNGRRRRVEVMEWSGK